MGPKIMFHIVKGQKLSQFHAKSVTVCTPVIPLLVSGKSELISLLRYDLHYGRNCIFILFHHPPCLSFGHCHILSNQLLSKTLLAHLFSIFLPGLRYTPGYPGVSKTGGNNTRTPLTWQFHLQNMQPLVFS